MIINKILSSFTAFMMLSSGQNSFQEEKFSASYDFQIYNSDFYEYNFPDVFDLRESGLISSVKNQGNYGTCWAFSASAAIESSMIKENPFVDISEMHLSYFSFFGDDTPDKPGKSSETIDGGHITYAVSAFSRGDGPVDEELLPYDINPENIPDELDNTNTYFLKDAYCLNAYSKSKIYPDEMINFSENEIKKFISDGKPICINFRYENSFKQDTSAQYTETGGISNHSVILVGWDDNFSSKNFLTEPPGDGAWLAKNSWGSEWGEDGYFWISYYDRSLCDTCCLEAEPAGKYSGIYQHDTLPFSAALTADNTDRHTAYMANIFTAEKDEYVTAAGLYTTDNKTKYEIYVYTDLKYYNDPTSGKQSNITSGSEDFAGYHTIELNTPVKIKKGEKFSVVAKLSNPNNLYPIPAEAAVILSENRYPSNVSSTDEAKIEETSSYGESFISSNGTKWTDTKNLRIEEAYENQSITNTNIAYYIGNVCLKAFTGSYENIYFSPDFEKIADNTKISMYSSSGSEIRFTTDGSIPDNNSPVYTEPIEISGDITLTASIFENGAPVKIFKKNYTKASSVLSSLTVNSSDMQISKQNIPITDLYAEINTVDDYVEIIPSGTGEITINGKKIISGKYNEKIYINAGYNKIKIKSSEEGMNTTEYTLTIFRSYAIPNYKDETIHLTGNNTSVSAEDGHIFYDGDSISDYLGQTLSVTNNNNTTLLKLSEREDLSVSLSSLRIITGSESLSSIFSCSERMMFSTSSDMKNAINVDDRRYNILGGSYFKIYPDYETDLYFQIPASDTTPASTIFHVKIPKRPIIDEKFIEITNVNDNSFTFSINIPSGAKAEYKTVLKHSADPEYLYNITDSSIIKENSVTVSDLKPGQEYSLYIMLQNTSEQFASLVHEFTVRTEGNSELCYFDFKNETIIFNDDIYKAFTEEGTEIHCFDSVSELTGTNIIFISTDGTKQKASVPERLETFYTEIDYINSMLTGEFEKSIYFRKRKANSNYWSSPLSSFNLSGNDNIINASELYFYCNSGDVLSFYRMYDDEHFSSLPCEITVPEYKQTPKKLLDIVSYSENEILLEEHEEIEYGIRSYYGEEFIWQDSPLFSGLKSGKKYILAVRYKSSKTNIYGRYTCCIINTLSDDYISGDVTADGIIDSRDLLTMKKFILNFVTPDSEQMRNSDIIENKKIDIFDLIALKKTLLFSMINNDI